MAYLSQVLASMTKLQWTGEARDTLEPEVATVAQVVTLDCSRKSRIKFKDEACLAISLYARLMQGTGASLPNVQKTGIELIDSLAGYVPWLSTWGGRPFG